jgi:hypothetical protein
MKYLKRWESLLNESEISDTLEDIFLDLKDTNDNFDIRIMDDSQNTYLSILDISDMDKKVGDVDVIIDNFITPGDSGLKRKRQSFSIEEVEEVIWRMINYMSGLGYTNFVFSKLRIWDTAKELIMSEGDYTRYKLGSQEWRLKDPISVVQIKFRKP